MSAMQTKDFEKAAQAYEAYSQHKKKLDGMRRTAQSGAGP
jgi:hypothetical protein